MATYAIYSYEIQEGNKSLFYKETGIKAIDMAQEIVDNILSDGLTIIGKKRKQDNKLKILHYKKQDDITTFVLCNDKDLTVYEGHDSQPITSHPGSYIIIDNRENVCQIAIEKNSAFDSDTDKVVKYIRRTFNTKLSDYGLKAVIKHKIQIGEFKKIIKERLVKDTVKKIVFDFPNTQKVKGIDASEVLKGQLEGVRLFTQASNALKGKLTLTGSKGNPLNVDEETNEYLAMVLVLCAQNHYNVAYHFQNSSTVTFKNAVHACHFIDNKIINDFEIGIFVDYGEGTTYQLIEVLDQIREEIADYTNEKIIDEQE